MGLGVKWVRGEGAGPHIHFVLYCTSSREQIFSCQNIISLLEVGYWEERAERKRNCNRPNNVYASV